MFTEHDGEWDICFRRENVLTVSFLELYLKLFLKVRGGGGSYGDGLSFNIKEVSEEIDVWLFRLIIFEHKKRADIVW